MGRERYVKFGLFRTLDCFMGADLNLNERLTNKSRNLFLSYDDTYEKSIKIVFYKWHMQY